MQLELSLSERQIPDLLETLVVRSDGWSCSSRASCAQVRRAALGKDVSRHSDHQKTPTGRVLRAPYGEHTSCGAVKGAIDGVVVGNLTGLLARIKPAIPATKFDGEKLSKNLAFVDAVVRTNVILGLAEIRRCNPVLEDLEKKRTIKITAAMYDLATGMVEFVA